MKKVTWSSVIGGSTFWKHAVLHEREREREFRQEDRKEGISVSVR